MPGKFARQKYDGDTTGAAYQLRAMQDAQRQGGAVLASGLARAESTATSAEAAATSAEAAVGDLESNVRDGEVFVQGQTSDATIAVYEFSSGTKRVLRVRAPFVEGLPATRRPTILLESAANNELIQIEAPQVGLGNADSSLLIAREFLTDQPYAALASTGRVQLGITGQAPALVVDSTKGVTITSRTGTLSLASGVSGIAEGPVVRQAGGTVFLGISLTFTATKAAATPLLTVPTDFRPTSRVRLTMFYEAPGTGALSAVFGFLETDGNLYCYSGLGAGAGLYGHATWVR